MKRSLLQKPLTPDRKIARAAYLKKWKEDNKDRIKAWQSSPERLAKARIANREWRAANNEKSRECARKYRERMIAEAIARGDMLTPEEKALEKARKKQETAIRAKRVAQEKRRAEWADPVKRAAMQERWQRYYARNQRKLSDKNKKWQQENAVRVVELERTNQIRRTQAKTRMRLLGEKP